MVDGWLCHPLNKLSAAAGETVGRAQMQNAEFRIKRIMTLKRWCSVLVESVWLYASFGRGKGYPQPQWSLKVLGADFALPFG